jgi:hypothetical protein
VSIQSLVPSRQGFYACPLDFNSFNESVKKDLPPINIDESLAIASGGISCPAVGVASGFDVTVDTKVNAQVVIGVAASGTIIPPSIDSFAIYSSEQPRNYSSPVA